MIFPQVQQKQLSELDNVQELNKYTIGKSINSGGFGEVFHAYNKQSKEQCAIKIISIDQYAEKMKIKFKLAKERIAQEVALQKKVNHPNVIKIIEHFSSDDKYYIVMELAENKDLKQYISKLQKPLETLTLLNIVIQICNAVEATHACSIIHRDLKPENFVFSKDNNLKLTDFGLARECKYAISQCGTNIYMSPEARNGKEYFNSTDIFSLGCILFELMENPFRTYIITNDNMQFTHDYPEPLQQICIQMLDYDSRKRPTIDQIKKEVEELSISICQIGTIGGTLNHVEYQYEIQSQQKSDNDIKKKSKDVIEQSNINVQKFNQIIDDATQWQLQLQFFIDDQVSSMSQNMNYKQIDLSIFKEISNAIIQNHVHKQKDILSAKDIYSLQSEIIFLKNNFSTLKTEDGIFYGEINTKKVEEFRKHVRIDGSFSIGTFIDGELTGFCQSTIFYSALRLKQIYFGEYRNNVKCGIGKQLMIYNYNTQQFTTESQNEYIGEWKDDQKNGPGNLKMINMNCVGLWEQDQISGSGQVIMNNGQVYEGIWENDSFQTQIKFQNGDIYLGSTVLKYDIIILQGQGKMVYYNGDEYEGEWDDNKRNGEGTQTQKNGSIYQGEWHMNERHGQGSMQFENGDKYEGEWKDDQMNGFGKMQQQNGEVLRGIWRNSELVGRWIAGDTPGHGKIILNDGRELEGRWDSNNFQTHFQLENGDVYSGDVDFTHDGVSFCGRGKMQYQNGYIYEGEWHDNQRHGEGTQTYKNESIYIGGWRENKRWGKGSMQFEDGDKYEGMWEYDQMNGFGKMQQQNGDVLEGIWRNSELVGRWIAGDTPGYGKIVWKDGREFEGRWDKERFQTHFQQENGDTYTGDVAFTRGGVTLSGLGKMMYQNGDVYEGGWYDNQRFGDGTLTYKNGSIYTGEWINNKRLNYGSMQFENGDKYVGQWESDQRYGYGTQQFANGYIYIGEWEDDKMHGEGKLTKQNGEILDGLWKFGQFINSNKSKGEEEEDEDENVEYEGQ